MSPNDLFAEALPLRRPWIISDSRLESKPGEARRLHLTVDLEEGCRRLATLVGAPLLQIQFHRPRANGFRFVGASGAVDFRIGGMPLARDLAVACGRSKAA